MEVILMDPHEASLALRIKQEQFWLLSPCFPRLVIIETGAQRYPAAYVRACRSAFPRQRLMPKHVVLYRSTQEAWELLWNIMGKLRRRLSSQDAFTADQVGAIFRVNKRTVQNWRQRGVLSGVPQWITVGSGTTARRQHAYVYHASQLHALYRWNFPG